MHYLDKQASQAHGTNRATGSFNWTHAPIPVMGAASQPHEAHKVNSNHSSRPASVAAEQAGRPQPPAGPRPGPPPGQGEGEGEGGGEGDGEGRVVAVAVAVAVAVVGAGVGVGARTRWDRGRE